MSYCRIQFIIIATIVLGSLLCKFFYDLVINYTTYITCITFHWNIFIQSKFLAVTDAIRCYKCKGDDECDFKSRQIYIDNCTWATKCWARFVLNHIKKQTKTLNLCFFRGLGLVIITFEDVPTIDAICN